MTKVEVHYELPAPLDHEMLEAIRRAHGVYGMQGVRLDPALDGFTVLYDASRLRLEDVDAVLRRAGLPIRRATGD